MQSNQKDDFALFLFGLLATDVNYSAFIEQSITKLADLHGYADSSFLEIDPNQNIAFFRAASGSNATHLKKFIIPKGEGIIWQALNGRLPIEVNNASDNAAHLKQISESLNYTVNDLLVVPVQLRGRVFGAVELLNCQKRSAETLEQVRKSSGYFDKALEVMLLFNGYRARFEQKDAA